MTEVKEQDYLDAYKNTEYNSIRMSSISRFLKYLKKEGMYDKKESFFDMKQSCLLAMWKALKYYNLKREKTSKFTSYLYKLCLQQLMYDFKAKNKIIPYKNTKSFVLDKIEYDDKEFIENVKSKLCARHWEIIHLKFFENKTFEQIGKIYGYSAEKTRLRVKKILKRLKTVYGGVL